MSVTYNKRCDYWVVDIQCKDRQKLLFDTVCTLADMGYDVYHATIDGEHGNAHQEVRPAVSFPAAVVDCHRVFALADMPEVMLSHLYTHPELLAARSCCSQIRYLLGLFMLDVRGRSPC